MHLVPTCIQSIFGGHAKWLPVTCCYMFVCVSVGFYSIVFFQLLHLAIPLVYIMIMIVFGHFSSSSSSSFSYSLAKENNEQSIKSTKFTKRKWSKRTSEWARARDSKSEDITDDADEIVRQGEMMMMIIIMIMIGPVLVLFCSAISLIIIIIINIILYSFVKYSSKCLMITIEVLFLGGNGGPGREYIRFLLLLLLLLFSFFSISCCC